MRRVATLVLITLTVAACGGRGGQDDAAPILLFTGTGTSPSDVAAVKAILTSNHLTYATATSSQLNKMDEARMRAHRLLIVPGGNFIDIGRSLAPGTTATIHAAVRSGLNYLGICAGGFFAGDSGYNGLNLTAGVRFGFYAAEAQGIRKAAVRITGAGTPPLDQYWEDGPQFTGWGAVVATYPDGTPAVVEGAVGGGWVVLTGVHAEAPERWRRSMTFTTPIGADHEYAAMLVRSALTRTALSR
ncbi:MAG: BPL-N domain-containing protein [Acidobacteriota bacterium]